jgi:Trk K+ transport system NAD-binding subunit
MPLALQLGRTICLATTLVGALAAGAMLWRQPVGRLRARLVKDATILTGLDAMTIPLLRCLTAAGHPSRVVVIEPDQRHPLLDEARGTGAQIVVADPASRDVLMPLLRGLRGPQLRYLYSLRPEAADNEEVLSAARFVMEKIRADPDSPPHLIARIDDPRHADLWRGQRIGASRLWFEDALCPQETTARALVNQVFRANARQILLCGDSRLALAVLLELAHRAWERRALAEAAASGRAAGQQAYPHDGPALAAAFRQPAERIVLLDRRAEDLRREYLATSPRSLRTALPAVETCSGAWRDQLLACLDIMTSADAAETAVLIADAPTEDGLHEAGRVARLHPRTPVFVLSSDGAGVTGAAFDRLHPFQRAFLVDGQAPEDTWTRIARHWHECYRLMHPAVPGGPKELTRRPWADLPPFIREDNILQLRSVMAAVAARGRHWVPVAAVVPGSFVELSGHDLEEVARQEHSRWYERRWADGWRPAAPGQKDDDAARINSNVRPWSDLPAVTRQRIPLDVQSQLEQLEAVGFVPIVPDGGPGDSAEFRRVGEVLAERLMASQTWRRQSGDQLTGAAGDWSVVDDAGDERTIRDLEFRASHEQLSGNRWRRTGYVRAWRVSEAVALRTMEGRAVAQPGDWIVQGPRGERWPVSDEQFRRGYLPVGRT